MYSVYKNGNYIVHAFGYGSTEKRCLRRGEDLIPEFPDSLDLKLSNRCSTGCPYCHEESVKDGKLADYDTLIKHLSILPEVPIEIAIGGGNMLEDEESKELLKKVLAWCWSREYRANLTINEDQVTPENLEFLSDYARTSEYKEIGIGISLTPGMTEARLDNVLKTVQGNFDIERHVVFHVILGLFPIPLLKKLVESETGLFSAGKAILFLGYKQYGRARGTKIPEKGIKEHERLIKETILKGRCGGIYERCVFGFDNLALEQINLEASLLTKEFKDVYFGPEFSCSMYVDAVKGEYAKTSRDSERVGWDNINLIDFFNHDKNSK